MVLTASIQSKHSDGLAASTVVLLSSCGDEVWIDTLTSTKTPQIRKTDRLDTLQNVRLAGKLPPKMLTREPVLAHSS